MPLRGLGTAGALLGRDAGQLPVTSSGLLRAIPEVSSRGSPWTASSATWCQRNGPPAVGPARRVGARRRGVHDAPLSRPGSGRGASSMWGTPETSYSGRSGSIGASRRSRRDPGPLAGRDFGQIVVIALPSALAGAFAARVVPVGSAHAERVAGCDQPVVGGLRISGYEVTSIECVSLRRMIAIARWTRTRAA